MTEADWDTLLTERPDTAQANGHRTVTLTPASRIKIRPVHWLWDGRLALGTMALIGGREGIGKSTLAYQLAADLTQGRLPGVHLGRPKSVIVAATEDSWEHTIGPRLMAAGADRDRVFRVDVTTALGTETSLVLPKDVNALEGHVMETDAAMILLDPIMSRLDVALDTHKDADVRVALEPLVALANRAGVSLLGLIHLNKSSGTDPLTMLMGSRAFAATARAVLFVMRDPDDEDRVLVGQPKNNLGRIDLPTLAFRIKGVKVMDTDEGEVWTGQVTWDGESDRSIQEALDETGGGSEVRTATAEAADWLQDYLTQQGGIAESKAAKADGRKEGHSLSALDRGRQRLKAQITQEGFPRRTWWSLPGTQPSHTSPVTSRPGESETTELTETTEATGAQSLQSTQSFQSPHTPRVDEATDPTLPWSNQ